MPYPVRYHCPRCGTIATLERSGYLADKSVTPYPLEGWTYADVDEAAAAADEADPVADGDDAGGVDGGADDPYAAADGVRIVCGQDGTGGGEPSESEGGGCGEPYYLNFVRFEDGREVEPEPESELVELAPDRPRRPRWPGGPGR